MRRHQELFGLRARTSRPFRPHDAGRRALLVARIRVHVLRHTAHFVDAFLPRQPVDQVFERIEKSLA